MVEVVRAQRTSANLDINPAAEAAGHSTTPLPLVLSGRGAEIFRSVSP